MSKHAKQATKRHSSKEQATGKQGSLFGPTVLGVQIEMSAEDAAAMGAFVEDALSEQDAIESYEMPVEHDPFAPPEGWSNDAERRLAYLRGAHRILSEQIVAANRELARLAVHNHLDSEEAAALRERVVALQAQRTGIDVDIEAEIKTLKALQRKPEAQVGSGDNKAGLLRVRHPNRDFFLADLFDYALKDDGASMEAPIFTLSTKPDLSIWQWTSKDGSKSIKVAPSVLGRATQFDKDVLIYVISQLTEALNRGRDDTRYRTVRFTVYDFLVTTNRGVSGDDYKRLQEAFERLAGTRITTDIKTGGQRIKQGFGIIDTWQIIEKSPTDERMIAVEITLSKWLYNAVQAFEVLTIHPDYFRLRKPLARRLYELARKHCGHQAQWTISLPLLHEKSGSKAALKEFHEATKAIAASDHLPEYRMSLSTAGRLADVKVTFYTIDTKRLVRSITKT
jgi:hypothetical protein